MIKRAIAKFYIFYYKKFPLHRGKNFIGRILNSLFGNFIIPYEPNLLLSYNISSPSEIKYLLGGESQIEDHIRNLKEGSIFVDVGANIGLYSLLAARQVGPTGKVFAFEPSYREYRNLLGNIMLNDIGCIIPNNTAIGEKPGVVEIAIKDYQTGGNFIASTEIGDKVIINTINITSLDDVFRGLNDAINLVKIDVEGYELKALKGMQYLLEKGMIELIMVEITDKFLNKFGDSASELYKYMEDFNYRPKMGLKEWWQYDELFIRHDIGVHTE